jgi:hypothetical protein
MLREAARKLGSDSALRRLNSVLRIGTGDLRALECISLAVLSDILNGS